MRRRATISVWFCAAWILALAGCSKPGETIKIGLAGALTGSDGQLCTTLNNGILIAIDEWNASGGVLGKKIEAVSRDDEGKPNQAVAVAQELASAGVVAVIGHFNSGCTIPASDIYAAHHIVQITPGSTNPQVTERGIPTLFRIVGRDDQQGRVAAEYLKTRLSLQKIAILHNKTAYGQGLAEEVKRTFESMGGTVTNFSGVSEEENDFRANLTLVHQTQAQALFWGGMYGQAGPLLVQLRSAGSKIPFLSGDGSIEKELIHTAGANATNVFLTFGPDFKQMPTAAPFLTAYRAKYGEEGPYSVYGYAAAQILFRAIQQANTTDAVKLAAALHSTTFDTALGPIAFNEKGDLQKPNYVIWTVKDGAFTVLP